MKVTMYRWMIAVTILLIIFVADTLLAETETANIITGMREEVLEKCQGKFKGKKPNPEELKTVFNAHSLWQGVYHRKFHTRETRIDPRRGALCGADLSYADLSRADLSGANLRGANLRGAMLSKLRDAT